MSTVIFNITLVFAFKQLRRKWRVLTSLHARETFKLIQQETSTLSLQICVCQTVWT